MAEPRGVNFSHGATGHREGELRVPDQPSSDTPVSPPGPTPVGAQERVSTPHVKPRQTGWGQATVADAQSRHEQVQRSVIDHAKAEGTYQNFVGPPHLFQHVSDNPDHPMHRDLVESSQNLSDAQRMSEQYEAASSIAIPSAPRPSAPPSEGNVTGDRFKGLSNKETAQKMASTTLDARRSTTKSLRKAANPEGGRWDHFTRSLPQSSIDPSREVDSHTPFMEGQNWDPDHPSSVARLDVARNKAKRLSLTSLSGMPAPDTEYSDPTEREFVHQQAAEYSKSAVRTQASRVSGKDAHLEVLRQAQDVIGSPLLSPDQKRDTIAAALKGHFVRLGGLKGRRPPSAAPSPDRDQTNAKGAVGFVSQSGQIRPASREAAPNALSIEDHEVFRHMARDPHKYADVLIDSIGPDSSEESLSRAYKQTISHGKNSLKQRRAEAAGVVDGRGDPNDPKTTLNKKRTQRAGMIDDIAHALAGGDTGDPHPTIRNLGFNPASGAHREELKRALHASMPVAVTKKGRDAARASGRGEWRDSIAKSTDLTDRQTLNDYANLAAGHVNFEHAEIRHQQRRDAEAASGPLNPVAPEYKAGTATADMHARNDVSHFKAVEQLAETGVDPDLQRAVTVSADEHGFVSRFSRGSSYVADVSSLGSEDQTRHQDRYMEASNDPTVDPKKYASHPAPPGTLESVLETGKNKVRTPGWTQTYPVEEDIDFKKDYGVKGFYRPGTKGTKSGAELPAGVTWSKDAPQETTRTIGGFSSTGEGPSRPLAPPDPTKWRNGRRLTSQRMWLENGQSYTEDQVREMEAPHMAGQQEPSLVERDQTPGGAGPLPDRRRPAGQKVGSPKEGELSGVYRSEDPAQARGDAKRVEDLTTIPVVTPDDDSGTYKELSPRVQGRDGRAILTDKENTAAIVGSPTTSGKKRMVGKTKTLSEDEAKERQRRSGGSPFKPGVEPPEKPK